MGIEKGIIMSLLKDLTSVVEATDMTELPYDIINDIQTNIRKGAADLEQDWASALHVVHKAYELEGVERPTPGMAKAWKQYETNIQYAVQMLVKYRGVDGDWRTSALLIREAAERKMTFRVTSESSKSSESYTTKAKSIDDLLDAIEDRNEDLMDVTVNKAKDGQSATIRFAKWGVKRNYRVKIEAVV